MLLSSPHTYVNTANNENIKPDTVPSYNSTIFGVDVFDQMVRQYSTESASRR